MAAAKKSATDSSLPAHIGIIMDGNGRWATRRGLPRNAGHRQGSKTFEKIVDHALKQNIAYLTVYTLSTENLEKRPQDEVEGILDLLRSYLKDRRKQRNKEVRTRFIGEMEGLPEDIQASAREMEDLTRENVGLTLNLAINYGGRREIVQAARRLMLDSQKGLIAPEDVSEELFETYLYTAGQPEVDLIIRTGGDLRTSNFLIWQASYAELYSTPILWPDFGPEDFDQALAVFGQRTRRKGGL